MGKMNPLKLDLDKWAALAGMRFLLASIVMLTHLGSVVPGLPVVTFLGGAAFEAIVGFLLISGYSIGYSYRSRPQGFYLRRAERIYPAYIAALALSVVAYGWPGLPGFAANLLFLNQAITTTSFIGPAWSLSLEVWLYALTPLLALLAPRKLIVLAAASFVCFVAYLPLKTVLHLPYFSGVGFGGNLVLLSCFWVAGFILATHDNPKLVLRSIGLMTAIALATSVAIQAAYRYKHGAIELFLVQDLPLHVWQGAVLAAVVAILWLAIHSGRGGRRPAILNWLGDLSYPLYLVHLPLFSLLVGWRAPWLALAALGTAAIVMLVFEYPVRRLNAKSKPAAIGGGH